MGSKRRWRVPSGGPPDWPEFISSSPPSSSSQAEARAISTSRRNPHADKPGALHSSLQPLRRHRINMTKIESRPSKRKAWEYFFFVDLDGHISDKRIAKATEQLGEHCAFVKILGAYPNVE